MSKRLILFSVVLGLLSACGGFRFSERLPDNSLSIGSRTERSLQQELEELEENLSDGEYLQYQVALSKLKGISERIYFLKLSQGEKKIYLSYIFRGEVPIVRRSGFFNSVF